jgi:SPP1 gp7 family putative phage head morphogenesis protein
MPPTKAQKRQVAKAMSIIAHEAGRLPDAEVRALAPVLAMARQELARGLAAWLRKTKGTQRFTAQRYRVAMLALEHALDQVRGRLDASMLASLGNAIDPAGSMAVRHLADQVAMLGPVFGMSVRPPNIERAAVLATGRRALIPRFQTSAARYAGAVRSDIMRQLSLGVVQGETFDEMTTRMARSGGPRGVVFLRGMPGQPGARSEVIAEGLFARYRHWGERVVRTEVMGTYNHMHHTALVKANRSDPGYMQRWDASADHRVCSVCRGLDGVIAALGKSFGQGYKRPPGHPNCRCVLTPWRKEWGDTPFRTSE